MHDSRSSFSPYPLLMAPIFSERPWGGRRLAAVLGKDVPESGGPWGEAWELSDHPAGRSAVANGPCAGQLFGDLTRRFPREMCGAPAAPARFPLLIKFIDAGDDLSIQVHPSDATAPAGDRGKTECWYIMDCEPGAAIVYGLAGGVGAASLRAAAQSGAMEPCLRRVPIRKGDFLDVPAGTVHAILAGTLICEVQQSSDTTYRLWDWDRRPPRPLHIEESCAVAEYDPAKTPAIVSVAALAPGAWHRLLRNDFFEVSTAAWGPGQCGAGELANPHGLALNVVEGGGTLQAGGWPEIEILRTGQTWFLPAALQDWSVQAGAAGLRLLASASREL